MKRRRRRRRSQSSALGGRASQLQTFRRRRRSHIPVWNDSKERASERGLTQATALTVGEAARSNWQMERQDGDKVKMGAGSAQQMKGWRTQAPAGRDDLSALGPPAPSHLLGQMTNREPITSKVITTARDGRHSLSCVSAPNWFWQLWILQPWDFFFFLPHHVDSVEVPDWLPDVLLSVSAAQWKALFNSAYLFFHWSKPLQTFAS